MALRVWLPLNGSNTNIGVSGITMSGSPASWGAGKVGTKAATFNNNTANAIIEPSNQNSTLHFTTQDFSWAMWVKKNYSAKTAAAMWVFTVGRADSGGYGYGLSVTSTTALKVAFGTSNWTISSVPDNEWHHIAFTRSGTKIKIYRDGTLVTDTTFSGTLPTYSDGYGLGVGCFHHSSFLYPLIGAVQDFRIYDHALSDKEVSEISMGMMLHYPMYTSVGLNSTVVRDTSGMGNDGTLYASPTFGNGSPRYSTCIGFSSGSCIWPIPDPFMSTMAEFTVSVWFKTTASGNQAIWNGRSSVGAPFSIFLISGAIRVDDSTQTTSVTVSTNTWYHLAITWKSGGNKVIYLNGEQKTSVSAGTLSKSNTKASIGCSSSGDSLSAGNYFYGNMSDFRIYATAFTATQVKELYNTPISIANDGDCHAIEFSEGATGISFNKTGVVSSANISALPGKYDNHVLIEPDGSCWMRIFHHGDPSSNCLFASTDTFSTGVWRDSKRFFDASFCDLVDKWEFLIEQKPDSSTAMSRYRWTQTKNPNTAVFADVAASAVTKKGAADGYSSINNSYGGIYKFNSNTYYCANNGTSGNWFCAIGSWKVWNDGIPGYNGIAVVNGGFLDLYIRIDNVNFSSGRTLCSLDKAGKSVLSTNFIEQ